MMEASHYPFSCWTSSREAVNLDFIVFGLTQPGTEPESNVLVEDAPIHSTTDRLTWLIFVII